jgi:hypothetical protein
LSKGTVSPAKILLAGLEEKKLNAVTIPAEKTTPTIIKDIVLLAVNQEEIQVFMIIFSKR